MCMSSWRKYIPEARNNMPSLGFAHAAAKVSANFARALRRIGALKIGDGPGPNHHEWSRPKASVVKGSLAGKRHIVRAARPPTCEFALWHASCNERITGIGTQMNGPPHPSRGDQNRPL